MRRSVDGAPKGRRIQHLLLRPTGRSTHNDSDGFGETGGLGEGEGTMQPRRAAGSKPVGVVAHDEECELMLVTANKIKNAAWELGADGTRSPESKR